MNGGGAELALRLLLCSIIALCIKGIAAVAGWEYPWWAVIATALIMWVVGVIILVMWIDE